MKDHTTVPAKALAGSYEVAFLVAQSKSPTLLLRASSTHQPLQLDYILLSNNTMRQQTHDIAKDIKKQLMDREKNSGRFSLKTDKAPV